MIAEIFSILYAHARVNLSIYMLNAHLISEMMFVTFKAHLYAMNKFA